MGTPAVRRVAWLICLVVSLPGCGLLPKPRRFEDPDYRTKLGMAKLLESQGQTERAGKLYRELARLDPKDAEPPHLLALLEAMQGRSEQAGEYFEQALKLAPRDVDLLNDYGYWLYEADRLDDAERQLMLALQVNPEHKQAINNLALVVGRRGRFDESLALFKRVGSDAEAHSNVAYVYAQLGQLKAARAHYVKALELDPRLNAAAEALAQLQRREADLAARPAAGAQ